MEYKYDEHDLNPGTECPVCGEQIVTWWTDQLSAPDDTVPESKCWLHTDLVKPNGIATRFSGNTIVIDHDGPQL